MKRTHLTAARSNTLIRGTAVGPRWSDHDGPECRTSRYHSGQIGAMQVKDALTPPPPEAREVS